MAKIDKLPMSHTEKAETTRMKILETALELFHRGSFTGTSLNQIVDKAGITKGALFHYFKGKNDLGYAVVEELIKPHIEETWVAPLATSVDPVTDMIGIIDGMKEQVNQCPEMIESGCPLNNLSQEMSSVDEEFRLKLLDVYKTWESAVEKAIRAGIDAGNVKPSVNPEGAAVTIIALMEGCIGMIKVNQDMEHMMKIGVGIRTFLGLLKAD